MAVFPNNIINSLRGLRKTSALKKVQRKRSLPQASLGSLSESAILFDPLRLEQIASELVIQLSEPVASQKLNGLTKTLVAVDGSVFHVLARIALLAWITNWSDRPTSGCRRQTHFEILRRLPKQIEATSANPNGEDAEHAVFEQTVEPVRCDVIDRGDQKYASWNKIHVIGSNDVCRVHDRFAYETMEQRELSLEASNADVLCQIIRLGHQTAKLDHTIRLICVR